MDELSLNGDGHRGMQTKCKESSPWAGVSRETSWPTLWVWSMSPKGGPWVIFEQGHHEMLQEG